MKDGGGDKPAGSGVASLLRLESQGSFRLLSIAAGCFLFFLVFVLSSRHDVIGLDILGARASLRAPAAAKTLPPAQGGNQSHGLLQQSNADETVTVPISSGVRDTAVVGVETNDDVEREAAEPAEEPPAAVTTISDDQAAPAAAGQHESKETAIAGQTTSPPHDQPANSTTRIDSGDQPRQPLCDFSDHRTDVCDFAGDIRMDANASTFVVVNPASGADRPTYKVRPYARKGDTTSMGRVTEITVRTTADAEAAPRCTRTHAAPAVVFSIGGYTGNLFHDFTDAIVPLYNTAQRYRGDVQLVVTDVVPWWLVKYGAILRGLSRHPPLDLAVARAAGEVHCFRNAVVGLRAHGELIIDRDRSPDGLGMPDFTRFLRRALSLPRDAPTRPGGEGEGDVKKPPRPRLLIISRRGTRLLLNTDEVVRAAEEVGFEAVVSGELYATATNDVAETGRLINSFDAVVGVHGAGLTNMVFLPAGAAMVQIVPWGGLRWVAQLDFGVPAVAMGLRYIQYEVTVEESTLKDKYPRDDVIFTNPTALHKKGFAFVRQTFLKDQDIIVDIDRFRAVLLQAFNSLAL